MKKLRLSSKKTAKRSIVNYSKCFIEQKGMTCNHPLQGSRFNRHCFFVNDSIYVIDDRYKSCFYAIV